MSFFRSISRVVSSVRNVAKAVSPALTTILPMAAPTLSGLTGSFDPIRSAVKTYAPAMMAASSFALPGVSKLLNPMLQNFGTMSDEGSTDYMPDPAMMQAESWNQPIRTQPYSTNRPLELPYLDSEESYGDEGDETAGLEYDAENDVYIDPQTGDVYGY